MSMRRWVFGLLAVLLAVGMLLPAGTFQPAWANSELHFGSRLFYPLWDVRGTRQTFIVISREALTVGNSFGQPAATPQSAWTINNEFDNCRPRGNGFGTNNPFPSGIGNTNNVNRAAGGGFPPVLPPPNPLFVDDVHFEYYGKTCVFGDEVVHMSCADVDLFVLDDASPRPGFASVAFEGVGALDVHLIINQTGPGGIMRKDENSLMGYAIISDVAEGWAATYPAAAAKSTTCRLCNALDGGTTVGYEAYPQEVYIPGVFAERFVAPGGQLSNLLSLWAPNLLPGSPLDPNTFALLVRWWDGRERPFDTSIGGHSIVRTIGDPIQSGQDQPTSIVPTFNIGGFWTCAPGAGQLPLGPLPAGPLYLDDGIILPDPVNPSDNFDGQGCTTIGTFRFQLVRDGQTPPNIPANFRLATDNSGRGLVGVVLSAVTGTAAQQTPAFFAVGDTIRLWHKDPCERAQSGDNFGPPHVRDASLFILDAVGGPGTGGSAMTIFNALTVTNQDRLCSLPGRVKSDANNLNTEDVQGFVDALGLLP
jgi:hypothetical protein